jgi:hypothetical protein
MIGPPRALPTAVTLVVALAMLLPSHARAATVTCNGKSKECAAGGMCSKGEPVCAPEATTLPAKLGPVTFHHSKHQGMESDKGTGCSACHAAGSPTSIPGFNKTMSKDTAHATCHPCHKKEGRGPQMCSDCHKRA